MDELDIEVKLNLSCLSILAWKMEIGVRNIPGITWMVVIIANRNSNL